MDGLTEQNEPILADGVRYTHGTTDIYDIDGRRYGSRYLSSFMFGYFDKYTHPCFPQMSKPSGYYLGDKGTHVNSGGNLFLSKNLLEFYSSQESAKEARKSKRVKEIVRELVELVGIDKLKLWLTEDSPEAQGDNPFLAANAGVK